MSFVWCAIFETERQLRFDTRLAVKEAVGTLFYSKHKGFSNDLASKVVHQKESKLQETRDEFFRTTNVPWVQSQLSKP